MTVNTWPILQLLTAPHATQCTTSTSITIMASLPPYGTALVALTADPTRSSSGARARWVKRNGNGNARRWNRCKGPWREMTIGIMGMSRGDCRKKFCKKYSQWRGVSWSVHMLIVWCTWGRMEFFSPTGWSRPCWLYRRRKARGGKKQRRKKRVEAERVLGVVLEHLHRYMEFARMVDRQY